jgi:hypothetical protein
MTAKINTQFRIFPFVDSHLLKDGQGYVNIRIANRKDRNKVTDIAVYLPSGERLKLKPSQMQEGKISTGMDEAKRNEINLYLDGLTYRINECTTKHPIFTKSEIENFLYGAEFLSTHKKARTRVIELKVTEPIQTEYYKELRNQHPKKREIVTSKSIDEDGFEVIEEKQIVIDPLSLENFPNNFNKTLYEQLKVEVLNTMNQESRKAYSNGDKFFLDQLILFYINSNNKFFKHQTKEIIKVDKDVINRYEQQNGKLEISAKGTLPYGSKNKLLSIKKDLEYKNLTTEQRYKQGLFNKENIFEIFASCYYDGTNETYQKIVLRLMEYRELVNPDGHITKVNADWFISFFQFLEREGWYTINTVNFDPLKYDRKIFFQQKEKNPYKPKSLNKMIGIVKALCKHFASKKIGLLPAIDLSELKLSAITDKKDVEGTRLGQNLNKTEIDTLFHFKFNQKQLSTYQNIFNEVNGSKNILISIDELVKAQKLFLLQVFSGGLRGYKELKTLQIQHTGDTYNVSFFANKTVKALTNPANDYLDKILKPLKFEIPSLVRYSWGNEKGKVSSSIELEEGHYRSLLQTIGKIINFKRKVLVDNDTNEYKAISEIFNPFFARKTFGQILYDELELTEDQIALFTGHKKLINQTELGSSYIQKNNLSKKAKLIAPLKVGLS